ncbi:hypothetical protein SNE26_27670 [Mucilaginibacter sp. cycad4]|uniref:hypothetical protein n=1 Tax=Mucilaginibacter sp. cycad4 TaxID=3342096 RepID=UPI002AAAB304|nr:hypothetical protein [Mucilaginibacter gossypii]WPU99794.1 hypothetical protein SNE26_27670 [Mucilaginibacter gossypii]
MGAGLTYGSYGKVVPCCLLFLCCAIAELKAQTSGQIINEVKAINSKITNYTNSDGQGMLISNKAMNIFLSKKASSYLSGNEDLSLYKNYVNINAAEGMVSINHNFHQPVDGDDWVRSFVVVGARVNIANAYSAKSANRYYDNQLGFTIQKTWMGKPKTYYAANGDFKMEMDAARALMVNTIAQSIDKKAEEFEQSLNALKQDEVPGQNLNEVKSKLRKTFYASLRADYLQQFSEQQSELLVNTGNYNLVTDTWTSLGIYIPVIPQKFMVSNDVNTQVNKHYNYPLELFVSHTRFWESPRLGRFFLTFAGKCFINNSVQSGSLFSADVTGQQGDDGTNAITINKGDRYIGQYKNFITPVAAGKLVYIPGTSHVGISFRIEKNWGTYKALNSIIGIPIVLIDKKGVPAINFEAQLLLQDMNNSLKDTRLPYNKTAIGLTVGIPFSKIVY